MFLCWESLERLSPLAKLEILRETLRVDLPNDKGRRPLQTIIELFRLRNAVAHAKPQTIEHSELRDFDDKLDSFLGEKPLTDWEKLVRSDSFAKRAREDVEAVLKKIQAARPEPKEPLFTFDFSTHGATLEH